MMAIEHRKRVVNRKPRKDTSHLVEQTATIMTQQDMAKGGPETVGMSKQVRPSFAFFFAWCEC